MNHPPIGCICRVVGKPLPLRAAEKLFRRINACFIARDKGGHGEVQANRETDFLLNALPPRRFARISPSMVAASRRLHEASPSP
jgi:hypothetical protein